MSQNQNNMLTSICVQFTVQLSTKLQSHACILRLKSFIYPKSGKNIPVYNIISQQMMKKWIKLKLSLQFHQRRNTEEFYLHIFLSFKSKGSVFFFYLQTIKDVVILSDSDLSFFFRFPGGKEAGRCCSSLIVSDVMCELIKLHSCWRNTETISADRTSMVRLVFPTRLF